MGDLIRNEADEIRWRAISEELIRLEENIKERNILGVKHRIDYISGLVDTLYKGWEKKHFVASDGIKKMLAIANKLDVKGFYKEAEEIDNIAEQSSYEDWANDIIENAKIKNIGKTVYKGKPSIGLSPEEPGSFEKTIRVAFELDKTLDEAELAKFEEFVIENPSPLFEEGELSQNYELTVNWFPVEGKTLTADIILSFSW